MMDGYVVSDSLIRDMITLHLYRGTVYVWIGLNHDIGYIDTLRWTVSTAVLAFYYCTSATWYPNGTAGGHASRFRRRTIHRSSHAHLKLSIGNLHSIWAVLFLSSSRARQIMRTRQIEEGIIHQKRYIFRMYKIFIHILSRVVIP